MKKNNKVVIIDGTSILTDAYYANIPEELLKAENDEQKAEAYKLLEKDSNGRYIGAIRGLFSVIFDAVDRLEPTHITVVWGTSRKSNIRKEIYPNYKADTSSIDEPLREQFKTAQILLAPLVKQFTSNKYEAIDLAGTIADKLKSKAEINILARNNNYLQLTDIANVYIKTSAAERLIEEYSLNKEQIPNGFFKYTVDTLRYVKDLEPSQVLGFNALIGNPSSGVPGVKGIGATTALPIIKKFFTIENIYEALTKSNDKELASIWKSIGVRNPTNKLVAGKENAFISKELLSIVKDVYVDSEEFNNMENNITLDKAAKELSKVGLLSELYVSGINDSIKATSLFGLINLNGISDIKPVSTTETKFMPLGLLNNYDIDSEILSSASIENDEKEFYSIKVSSPSIVLDNDWDYIHYDNDDYNNSEDDEDNYEYCEEVNSLDDIDDGGINCETETIITKDNNETISLIETIVIKRYKCNCCNNIFEVNENTPINFCVYCGTKNSSKKEHQIDNLEETGMKINDIKINKDIESVMEYI